MAQGDRLGPKAVALLANAKASTPWLLPAAWTPRRCLDNYGSLSVAFSVDLTTLTSSPPRLFFFMLLEFGVGCGGSDDPLESSGDGI